MVAQQQGEDMEPAEVAPEEMEGLAAALQVGLVPMLWLREDMAEQMAKMAKTLTHIPAVQVKALLLVSLEKRLESFTLAVAAVVVHIVVTVGKARAALAEKVVQEMARAQT